MLIGLVKWFDPIKGFGIVGTPTEGEYFLHINSFVSKPERILKGTPIAFLPNIHKEKKRYSAEKCRFIGNTEDWKIILCYLGKSDSVSIEVEITGRGKAGNPYHRKETQSFSLMELSFKYFLKDRSEEEILNLITHYFYNDLETKHFISYCELIENRIKKHLPDEIATNILISSFLHFGNNLNEEILFEVWKQKKFKFISFTDKDDYEIPENVLKSNIIEIGYTELKRIINFSYGPRFCSEFNDFKFNEIEHFTTLEIEDLYQFLEFESESQQEKRKSRLDDLYAQKITTELTEQVNALGIIKNNDDFYDYNQLLQLIPSRLDDENKNRISKIIYKDITLKCSEEFKPELWIKGIIEEAPFDSMLKMFLDTNTQSHKRISILSKLQTDKQLELLKLYSNEYEFENAFTLIEELLKKENSLGYYFNLSEVLFDNEFWNDKKHFDLTKLFSEYVNDESSNEQRFALFFKGYVKNIPQELVYQKISSLKETDFRKIFESQLENKTFIKEILERKAITDNISDFDWLYSLADKFLDKYNFDFFDRKVFETIEKQEYFTLWKKGRAKIFPQKQIEEILNDKFENYTQIKNWIDKKSTTTEEIEDFLFSYLNKQVPVTDRVLFYRQLNHIKYLLQLDDLNFEKIKLFQNSFYNIILWYLDKVDILDFEQLKQKFIYFAPDEQVRITRKLFFLKANGAFDLTPEKLNELTRFDLELYKTNLNFNLDIPVDISTDIVIKVLLSYNQTQRFFVESELLTLILNDLKLDKTKRFKLSNYFENCLGRQISKFNWSREGEIKKVNYGKNQFYFAISFPTGRAEWVNNSWGGREVYTPNPNFENLKESVKKLPEVRWNHNEKHWGVLSKHETEVLKFAKEQRFFLDFEGSNYANNPHLADFIREEIPNGISFCEGRLANRAHEIFKKEFWWCGGQPCFSKCETIHPKEEWEKYTLLDFCEILGFNTDEINHMRDHIPKGNYYQFIALINRFNRLLDKLYCRDCNHILYPSDFGTSHFAAHTIVRFQCRNESCSNNDEIYLNHCLNGQCNSIIDSRVSKKCDNGLIICDNCGSCCSHNMLERRLANLKLNGGYIHENLIKCVEEKLGHLERGEYFCYKCREGMTEVYNDFFKCSKCDVKYDTTKYKIKRPHIHLSKIKALTENNGNNKT